MNDLICLIGLMGVICLIYMGPIILAFVVYLLAANSTDIEEQPMYADTRRRMGLVWYLWHRGLPPFERPPDDEPPWMD